MVTRITWRVTDSPLLNYRHFCNFCIFFVFSPQKRHKQSCRCSRWSFLDRLYEVMLWMLATHTVHSAIHVGSTTNLLLLSMYTLGNKYLLRTFTYYNYYCCCCRHTVVSNPNFLPLPPAAACIKTGLKIEKKLLEIGFDEDFSVLHVSISIARIVSNQTYVSWRLP